MLRYDCPVSFSGRFASARSPKPCKLPTCVLLPARRWVEALHRRQGSWSAGTPPLPAVRTRRHGALPSSRVSPVRPCPALLRPRWNPAHLPYHGQDCCLPLAPLRRLWPSGCTEQLSSGPPLYSFRGSMTRPGLSLPPAPYSSCEVCTRRSLLPCWLGVREVGLEFTTRTHWETITYFMKFSSTP